MFGLFMLVLLLTRLAAPRYLLLPEFLAVVALAPFAVAPRTAQLVGIAVLARGAARGRSASEDESRSRRRRKLRRSSRPT